MMTFFDIFFDRFKWYRRWRGGIWHYVQIRVECIGGSCYWSRIGVIDSLEILLKVEDYTRLKPCK
jgi:hypothetical protein